MASIKVEILRSEKREVDEIDSKPFTMYVLKVNRVAKEDDGADSTNENEVPFADGSEKTVTLTRKDESLGFSFDTFSTGTYLTKITEGGTAEDAGLTLGTKILAINGKTIQELSKYDVSILLKGEQTVDVTAISDANGLKQGRADRQAVYMEWTLFRRYSQFDELKNCVEKQCGKLIKNIKFPPKVLLGNLKPGVVETRTRELGKWINDLLSHDDKSVRSCSELLSFLEASASTIKDGMKTPVGVVKDIHGRTLNTATLQNELVVYSAASRFNFQKLVEFIKPAQEEVVKKYPNLRCTFVSIADLRIVPDKMRSMIEPMLKKVESKDMTTLGDLYSSNHDAGFMGIEGYFVPDFSGEHLEALQFTDANWTFRAFISMNGHIQKSFQSSQSGLGKMYVKAFENLIEKYPETVLPFPSEFTVVAEGDEKVKKELVVNVEIDAPCTVAWQAEAKGHASFSLSKTTGENSELILPVRTQSNKTVRKRMWLDTGSYKLTWKATGTISAVNINYKVMKA
eukprot:m.209296 g.209296  ORF g.209296 m.209296 type:complete len:513 (+) comp33034_c1_seq1:90-1628(+)